MPVEALFGCRLHIPHEPRKPVEQVLARKCQLLAQGGFGGFLVARAQRVHGLLAQLRHERELHRQMVFRLGELRILRESGSAVYAQHLAVRLLHHEAAFARVHGFVRKRLLRRARPHTEEHAVERNSQLLKRRLIALRQVGLQKGEPFGQSGIVGRKRDLCGKLFGKRSIQLLLEAPRQHRVHAKAVLTEIDEI